LKQPPIPDIKLNFTFPHEEGAPSLAPSPTPVDKLKYGLEVGKWALDKHPVSSFKQAAKPGEIDPFEWQMVEALTQIDSIDRLDGVDAEQIQNWGQDFFDRLAYKSDYDGALQTLNKSGPKQLQNEIIGGAKEVVRAAVTQQLSTYLDRGSPSQTLKQFANRLNNPDDPVHRSAGFNMCGMSTQTSSAVERGTMQRNKAVKFKNDVSSQAEYEKSVAAFRHAVEEDNKKKADFNNLMRGREKLNNKGIAPVAPGIPNTQSEQWRKQFFDFVYPHWK
jgi:hypothetical protein